MKIMLTCLSLLSLLPLTGFAQDPSYQGAAKITVKSFWDGVAKLEKSIAKGGSSLDEDNFAGLQRKIDDTKKKDPAYATGPMQEKLKSLADGMEANKAKMKASLQASKDKSAAGAKAGELITSLFDVSVQVGRARLKSVQQEIADYNRRAEELLAIDRKTYTGEWQRYLLRLKDNYRHVEKDLAELDRRCHEQGNAEDAQAYYYELAFNQAHWDAARKLYPEESSFASAYALASRYLAGLGNPDQVSKLAAATKETRIKECRLPSAAVKDAALEKMFVDVFNQFHAEEFKGKAFRAVVTSADWSVERHERTGLVTGRIRKGVVVYKDREGRCFLTANIFIRQEFVGGSFTGPLQSAYPVMGSQQMLCENAR